MAQPRLEYIIKEVSDRATDSVNGSETPAWNGQIFSKENFENAVFSARKLIYDEHLVGLNELKFRELYPEYASNTPYTFGDIIPQNIRSIMQIKIGDNLASVIPSEQYLNALTNPYSIYRHTTDQYYFVQLGRVCNPIGFSNTDANETVSLLQPAENVIEVSGEDINDPELWTELIIERAKLILLTNQQEN